MVDISIVGLALLEGWMPLSASAAFFAAVIRSCSLFSRRAMAVGFALIAMAACTSDSSPAVSSTAPPSTSPATSAAPIVVGIPVLSVRSSENVFSELLAREGTYSFLEPGCVVHTSPEGERSGMVLGHGTRLDGQTLRGLNGRARDLSSLSGAGQRVDLASVAEVLEPGQDAREMCPGITTFIVPDVPVNSQDG